MLHIFLWLSSILSYGCAGFVQLYPTEGHLVCLQYFAFRSKAVINICVQVLCEHRVSFFRINAREYDCWVMWLVHI